MQSVSSNAVNSKLLNYALDNSVLKLVKSFTGNLSPRISFSDLSRESVYLVFAYDLNHTWDRYNIGVLLNYRNDSKKYYTISSSNNMNISVDGDDLVTDLSNVYIWGAKFYKVGYY